MQDEQQHPTGRPTPTGEPTPPPGVPPPSPQAVAGESAAPPPQKESQYPSLTQKQRRIGERIIEFGIFAIATTSIVTIFLIFIFIFKEASPIFFGGSEEKTDTVATAGMNTPTAPGSDTSGLESEQYGATATESDSSLESEQYNPAGETDTAAGTTAAAATTASTDDDEAELYNPEAEDIPSPGKTDSGSVAAAGGDDSLPKPAVKEAEPAEPTAEEREKIARSIVGEDYPILEHDSPVSFGYLFHDVWQPNSEHPRYGIYPIILGTLKTTLIALLIAAPLGVLAALYSAFFAPRWMRETLKPAIELLAGFPSVVLGFFCLMTVASVVQVLFGAEHRLNAVVGGIGLALAVIPIIYTISDDALRAVPGSLREAALALGASEWQVAYKIMLPAATPGIFAAILLGIGRAFGETMIALMATGNALTVDWSFFQSVRTFAATIGAEMGEVVFGSPHYQVLFLLGVILFVFSFLINFVTEFYVKKRLIRRFRGSE